MIFHFENNKDYQLKTNTSLYQSQVLGLTEEVMSSENLQTKAKVSDTYLFTFTNLRKHVATLSQTLQIMYQ